MLNPSKLLGFILVVGFGSALLSASPSQASRFSIVATGDSAKYSYKDVPAGTTADTVSSKIGYGGGVLLDYGVASGVGLQLGALYVSRTQDLDAPGLAQTTRVTHHVIQVPVTFRFHLLPHFSVCAGGYWAGAVGNNALADTNGNSLGTSSNSVLNQKSSDYGLVGGAAIYLPLTQRTSFLVDARYIYGLDNQVADGSYTKKTRDVQFMAGFTFAMMRNR